MDTLDVPEVTQLPGLGPNEEPAVAFADLVLTTLFASQPALLQAEHQHPLEGVAWFVRPLDAGGESERISVAISPSLGSFRSVLARFGDHYMGGQLYHGFATRFLQQRGETYRCLIYMSNTGQSGFWIRVYAALA